MFFVYDFLNSNEDYEPKKPWEREEHDMACEIHTTLFQFQLLSHENALRTIIFFQSDILDFPTEQTVSRSRAQLLEIIFTQEIKITIRRWIHEHVIQQNRQASAIMCR